ncbi:sigma factor for late transcription [archaeon]|nr:sigma factor for late transcription [archaeon]
MAKKTKQHYVDNKALLAEMIKFRAEVQEAKEKNLPRPIVSNYIGDCIMKIAEHLSYRPNFINYTYKEDMICDGIENCLLYIDNFDPDKSKNPFAYFTQIIYYAFIRRIQKEKKQMYVKYKSLENADLIEEIMHSSDGSKVKNTYLDFIQTNMGDFLEEFEQSQRNKKNKRGRKSKEEANSI